MYKQAVSTPFNMSSTRVITPSVTPSLINYVPSIIGGGFQSRFEDGINELPSSKSSAAIHVIDEQQIGALDKRCEELWRAFRDEAGPWMSHRFTIHEWNLCQIDKGKSTDKQEPTEVVEPDFGNGRCLTKEIIASGLSNLDRCPIFYHYSYTKCVLKRKGLCDIKALGSYLYLQYVDVSWNKLTTLAPLGNLPFLKYLDASHNYLDKILDFKAPYFLTSVNLSYNKIRFMKDLSDFWAITDLNLSHNSIRVIEGLSQLKYLTTLDLSYNRIETIENLQDLRIQFLYLRNNQIKYFEDDERTMLHSLNSIRTINLSYNQIASLKMFEWVENLECLEIPYNHISQLLDIYYLRNLKYLNKLNLLGNTVTNLRRYVEVCVTNIRNLAFLDGEHINSEFWLQKISNRATDVSQIAAHQRLKLIILGQLNKPQMWEWLLPYDTQPLAIIVLVGLQASKRARIAKKFCDENENVVLGIPYTTRTKHAGEIEGELFYYVNEAEFRTMMKQGKFLTFQEHLGFYYGFAHSEFKKAQDGILLFYTDLTMALSLKSRFLNTKLVLTLPSSKKVHLDNLSQLYAVRLIDSGTMKIINSPQAVKSCEIEFWNKRKKALEQDIRMIVEDMITKVTTRIDLDSESDMQFNSGFWQIWSAPNANTRSNGRMSHCIHPLDTFYYNIATTPFNSIESFQNADGSNKMVSFTADGHAQMTHNFNRPEDPAYRTLVEGDEETLEYEESLKPDSNIKSWTAGQTEEVLTKVRTASSPWHIFVRHETYSDILWDDERIRSIFIGELNQRDELLDLHWSSPGLFRELLLTDHEDETMRKLKKLVKELSKLTDGGSTPMFDYGNDHSVKVLTAHKINKCFKDMKREMSMSDKQMSEFVVEKDRHICGTSDCKNPACPPF